MNTDEDFKGAGELLDAEEAERNAEPKFEQSFDRTKTDYGLQPFMPEGVRDAMLKGADAIPVSPLAAFKDNTFTPEEKKKRTLRRESALRVLFTSDIENMTPEFAAGFYRSVHRNLIGLEDPDGSVAFGSRKSDDPKKNIEMLKQFCLGDHKVISSPERRAWMEMTWDQKFKYALEHETAGNAIGSHLKGDRGVSLGEMVAAGAQSGASAFSPAEGQPTEIQKDVSRRLDYESMTPEEKRKYEADVIRDYDERLLKDNRLAAYLELTADLSDKAKWLVAKGLNDGECDMDALRQLRGAEPERALTAIKMARGNQTRGRILGIDTDFTSGTAGDRLQMGLYRFQQGVIGLFADTYRFLENVRAYGVAKFMYDEKEFREFSDAMSFRAKFDQAFTQDLPEPESFMGEAYQGVMENLHWGLSFETSLLGKGLMASATGIARPTLGATLKALATKPSAWKGVIAEYGKTLSLVPNAKLADMGKKLAVAEDVFTRKQMRSLGTMMAVSAKGKEVAKLANRFDGEYLVRQAAAVDRLRRDFASAKRIARWTDVLGAGLATTGSMASFATFAQEYMDNAVAAGVDWDDALVTSVAVGAINAKIENIWVPGIEGGLSRGELGMLTMASFRQALANTVAKNGKRDLKEYFANWGKKYLASAGRAAFEEGVVEEPLQQIVIEHGIAFDKLLKEYGYTGPTQVLKAFLPSADDWKTFVDTAIEMLPNDFGFALTSLPMAVGRHSRNQALHNLWAKKWHYWRDERKRKRDYVADHGSLDGYEPALMPAMYTETGELSPEMLKGAYEKVTDLDYGVVDMIQRQIDLQQLVKDEWAGEDKGSVTDDPKKERGTRLKVAEKIQIARDVWKASDGTGDVVGAVADALGVGRRTAEVACSTFEAEGDFTDFNAKTRTVLNANFVLASLTEADLKEINPNFVDGSFERDEKTGSVKAEILINMGKDENGKDREPVRKTVVYRIGSSVLPEEAIPAAAAKGSTFGASWIGTHKGEIVNGRRVETWDELTDDERLELVKRDRWIAKGSAGPGATVVFTDKDGNEKTIDADFLVSFATGRIGDIGYGIAAKRSTMFHENFHVLWDSVKEFILEEDRKNLARKLDVDVEQESWDNDLQEKMAIQLEAYSGGQMVPQFSQNVIEGMQGGIRGALGGLLEMMAPKTINPETGREYELKDFYDAVLRGDIGNAAELLKAAAGKMPEKEAGTKPSEGKLPGGVTEEELAAKDAETAKSGEESAEAETSQPLNSSTPQPSQPVVRRPSWDHGDRIDRKCPGKKWKLKCKLVLMSVHDLVTQQAQGRDVTAKDYKDRVDEMARTWEIEEGTKIDNTVLLGVPTAFTKDVVPGAVDKSVFAGNTRTSAILKIYENGGDTADAFKASQEQLAEERGLERADGWENDPVVIALLEEVEVPASEKVPTAQEIADASNGNIASAYGASESAGAHATILIASNLIPLFQIDLKTGEIVDSDEAYKTSRVNPIGEFFLKAGGNKALPDFYRKDTTNLSEDGQRTLRNAILSALFGGRGGDTVARLMSEADRLGMQNEMAALVQLAPELLSLANDREHAKYDLRGPLVEALGWVQRWLDADEAARKSAGKTHAEWKRRKDGKPVEPAALATAWENFRDGDMTEKPSEEAVILGDLLAAAHMTLAWSREGEGGEERPSEASKLTARRLVTGYVRDYLENVMHATAPVEDGLFAGTEDAAAFAPPTTAEILRTQRGTRFSVGGPFAALGPDVLDVAGVGTPKIAVDLLAATRWSVGNSYADGKLSDLELIDIYRKGDPDALAELYRRYDAPTTEDGKTGGVVGLIARKYPTISDEEKEDLHQEVWVRIINDLDGDVDFSKFSWSTYIFNALRWAAANYYRDENKKPLATLDAPIGDEANGTIESLRTTADSVWVADGERSRKREVLRQLFEILPPDQAAVMNRIADGKTAKEIAKELGLHEYDVKNIKARVIAALKKKATAPADAPQTGVAVSAGMRHVVPIERTEAPVPHVPRVLTSSWRAVASDRLHSASDSAQYSGKEGEKSKENLKDPLRVSLGRLKLTPTEMQVVELTESGLSTKEIAERLGKSASTVLVHLSNARAKGWEAPVKEKNIFSTRELQVLDLRDKGLTSSEIAKETGLSVASVDVHLSNASKKGWEPSEEGQSIRAKKVGITIMGLSKREGEVWMLHKKGMSGVNIAKELGISANAVWMHLSNARKKTAYKAKGGDVRFSIAARLDEERQAVEAKGGELLLAHHGTDRRGFTRFEKSDDIGYFFAKSRETAASYIRKGRRGDENRPGIPYFTDVLTYLNDEASGYTPEEIEAMSYEEKVQAYVEGTGEGSGVYDVALKMEDPYRIDCHGANWDAIYDVTTDPEATTYDIVKVEYDPTLEEIELHTREYGESEETVEKFKSLVDFFRAFKERFGDEFQPDLQEIEKAYSDNEDYATFNIVDGRPEKGAIGAVFSYRAIDREGWWTEAKKTRDIVEEAVNMGCDGVIFYNVVDNGGGIREADADDVYVVMKPEQVKSVDSMTYADDGSIIPAEARFDWSNKDIRYSVGMGREYRNGAEEAEAIRKSAQRTRLAYNYRQKIPGLAKKIFDRFGLTANGLGTEWPKDDRVVGEVYQGNVGQSLAVRESQTIDQGQTLEAFLRRAKTNAQLAEVESDEFRIDETTGKCIEVQTVGPIHDAIAQDFGSVDLKTARTIPGWADYFDMACRWGARLGAFPRCFKETADFYSEIQKRNKAIETFRKLGEDVGIKGRTVRPSGMGVNISNEGRVIGATPVEDYFGDNLEGRRALERLKKIVSEGATVAQLENAYHTYKHLPKIVANETERKHAKLLLAACGRGGMPWIRDAAKEAAAELAKELVTDDVVAKVVADIRANKAETVQMAYRHTDNCFVAAAMAVAIRERLVSAGINVDGSFYKAKPRNAIPIDARDFRGYVVFVDDLFSPDIGDISQTVEYAKRDVGSNGITYISAFGTKVGNRFGIDEAELTQLLKNATIPINKLNEILGYEIQSATGPEARQILRHVYTRREDLRVLLGSGVDRLLGQSGLEGGDGGSDSGDLVGTLRSGSGPWEVLHESEGLRRGVGEAALGGSLDDDTRWSIASRQLDWDALPDTLDKVIFSTSVQHFTGQDKVPEKYELFKQYRDYGHLDIIRPEVERWAKFTGPLGWLGLYLKGKYYGDLEAARKVVRHRISNKRIGAVRTMLGTDNPVRWLYVRNDDGRRTNRLPQAYAEALAERFGGTVDDSIVKTSDQRNTSAGMRTRAHREFQFAGEPAKGVRYVIADDVWTTGQTTVSLLDYLIGKGADVRGITTLAVASHGDEIKPPKARLEAVLKKAQFKSVEDANAAVGLDLRKATGSELQAYFTGARANQYGFIDWFDPSANEFALDFGGRGRLEAGLMPPMFSEPERERMDLRRWRERNASQGTFAFSVGQTPSEPLVRAMTRRPWRGSRLHGVDRDVRWSVGGTIDEAFPQLREMSDDELVIAAEAVRLALNTKGKGRFMNITRMQRDLRGLDPSQSHEDLGVKAVGVIQAARNLAKKMRSDLDRGVSESRILAHLPDTMKEVFGSEMTARLRTGAKAGVYAERARKEIERRQEKVITDAVAIQSGVETKIMENAYGLDFSRTLMNLAENPYIRTDENGNRLPPERGEGEGGSAPDEQSSGSAAKPVEAKVAEAVNEVARRAHELSEAEKAKKEELRRQAGRDAENQLAFNQEENAAAADAGEGGGAMFTGDEDLVDVATRKAGVNLQDPRELALFVSELSRKYWNDTHGLGEKPDTWNDPVAMQFLRKTAANIYTKLVNDLVYSQARDTATRAINRFENVPTARGLVSEMTFVGQLIHAKRMADTQREMCNKLDAFLKEKFGAAGRFSPDKEELRRSVSAEMELRARYTRHVIWLTPDALDAEIEAMQKNLHGIEVEFDDAGRDVDQSKVMVETLRKLQILREFGGLVYKPLAQIQAAIEYWEDALRGDTDRIVRDNYERDLLTEKAAAKLAAAFNNPKLKTALEENLKSLFNDYVESHMGFFVLLRDMMRFAPDDVRAKAEPIIEYLELAVQKAGTRAMSGKRRHGDALAQAVQSIYHRDFQKVLAEFNQRDDRFLEFMGEVSPGKREIPTKGKAMQLFVSLLQVGHPVEVADKDGESHVEWIGGYHDNIVKNHREGQAEKIRRLLTVEDLNLIAWLGKWYEANRENLSTVAEALFGIGVYAETENYMPVKMLLDPQGLEKGNAVGWTIFPRSLTPRIRNERDFDTSADILSMFMSRMEESEQWASHAKLGLELRGIFGRSVLRKSIRASHGTSADKLVQGFITDILSGRGAGDLTTGKFSFYADRIRGMAALGALGGNIGVTLKQTTSIPAFGFELGLAKTSKYILSAWSPDGFAAMREIFESAERKNRWDVGNTEAVKNALSMNASGPLMKALKASMVTNKVGDVVPALVVGQGIYRDSLAQGMSREDAMARTWMLIERTQQSSRLENQPEFVRRSRAARALFQFLTTQVQYLGYEAKAIREVMAKPGDVRRWGSLGNVLLLNHFLLSSLYFGMGQLWKRLLGQEPPPDDELADWMVTCLLGPFGALYVAGFTATEALNVWVKGKKFGSQPTLPSLSWASNIIIHDPGSVLGAIFSHDKGTLDDVLSAAGKWLADFNATFRDLRKVYRYRVKKEPQRK